MVCCSGDCLLYHVLHVQTLMTVVSCLVCWFFSWPVTVACNIKKEEMTHNNLFSFSFFYGSCMCVPVTSIEQQPIQYIYSLHLKCQSIAPCYTYQISMSRLKDILFSRHNSIIFPLSRYAFMNPSLFTVKGKESSCKSRGIFTKN